MILPTAFLSAVLGVPLLAVALIGLMAPARAWGLAAQWEQVENGIKPRLNGAQSAIATRRETLSGTLELSVSTRRALATSQAAHGAAVLPKERRAARRVVCRRQLTEFDLAYAQGSSWERVDADAEAVEHVISKGSEDRMPTLLGGSTTYPVGAPIPREDGGLAEPSRRALPLVCPEQTVRMTRARRCYPAFLRHLGRHGLVMQPRSA